MMELLEAFGIALVVVALVSAYVADRRARRRPPADTKPDPFLRILR